MRLASFAVVPLLLLAGTAWAAGGDPLMVTGNGVNVRAGPGLEQRVQMQLFEGQAVTEIERVGDWVRVEVAGTAREGWIHQSLLAPVGDRPSQAGAAPGVPLPEPKVGGPPEPEVPPVAAPAVGPRPEPGAAEALLVEPAAAPLESSLAGLAQFRESVSYLNSRAVSVGGVDLFTGVEPLGGGTVQVATTEAWATVPPAGQESYVNTLVDRWAAAHGAGQARVQIVDPQGAVVMERSRP